MVKRTNDPRQMELVLPFPEPITVPPSPSFPSAGTQIQFRDTGASILVLGPDDTILGHVDPCQAPVLSRVLDRVFQDAITMEMGEADEATFEVVLHRRIDGDTKRTNVVRCTRHEPEHRQAA